METGKGVKPEKAEKALAKSADELAPGEVIWYFAKCNNLKPVTDAIVITNARVMGLSTGISFKFKALHSDIHRVESDAKRGTVTVSTSTGDAMTFKQVAAEDVPAVTQYIDSGRAQRVPAELAQALQRTEAHARSDRHPEAVLSAAHEEQERSRQEKREKKAAEKARRKQQIESRAKEDLDRYGEKIADEMFGMRTVRIYSQGYVRVSLPLLGSNARYERLQSIESSADVSKKSGLGRGAAAVVTAGYSLMSSNKRGDVYLTISTDVSTHVLHEDPPTAMNLKAAKRLEAAGRSVIGRSDPETVGAAPDVSADTATSPPDLRARLQELAALRNDGLISEEEHTRLRTKLLDAM